MKKTTLANFQKRLDEFLAVSCKEPVIIRRNGKSVAVLMGIHDEDEVERLVFASSRRLQEILDAGRKEIREGRGIPNVEFWQQVEAERPVLPKRVGRKKKAKST